MTYFVISDNAPDFIIQLYSQMPFVSRILAHIYVYFKYVFRYLCNIYTKMKILATQSGISHKFLKEKVKNFYRMCKVVKNYKLSLFSSDIHFAEKAEIFLCGQKGEAKKDGISFFCEKNVYFASAKESAKHFISQTDGENGYICPIVRAENFYDDILCAIKILPFCENAFIILADGGKTFSENIFSEKTFTKEKCAKMSEMLKTKVIRTDLKHRARRVKSQIFQILSDGKKSGWQDFYLNEILGFSKGVGYALYRKNPCLLPLAPHLIASDKSKIETLSGAVGIDLLDNIKILKELCVALELLKSGGCEKKLVLSEVENREEEKARRIFEEFL